MVRFTDRAVLETNPGADWRSLVLKRTSRLLAAVSVPGVLIAAVTPGPYGLRERIGIVGIAAAMVITAWLARDARRFRVLAAFLTGTITVLCLGLAMRTGMGPSLALALGSCLVLVAIFFGNRAVWGVAAGTALAMLGTGAAIRAGLLHTTDPAAMFDWTKMSVWVRIAAGFVAAASIAASAVAMVIAHLEDSLRDRDRLLVAEREAVLENGRLFEAEKRARERLARLQQITASLSRASTPEEVIEAACRTTSEALDGQSASLWRLGGDGALRLAGSWGAPRDFLDQFRIIPMGSNVPAQHVVRTGQPLWVETEDDYRTASREMHAVASAAGRLVSFCLLPLAVDGVVKAVVAFVQPLGHRFDDDERAYYATISVHCGQALERAILHDAARELALRAEAASRLKDEFLSTVSHELRTPLNAITGWVHMLRSDQVPADRREHALQVIDRNARVQAKLVADLLDVNLIRGGHMRMNVAPVEPAVVVQMAIDSMRPAAEANGVLIDVSGETNAFSNEPVLTGGPELRGLRFLIVEDEPDTRELLLALFNVSGAYAFGAPSAAVAIELFHREKPDVIVSDVGLRGEDGLTLVRKLRSLPGGDIPVVALTAFARPEDRENALAAGFDAHVTKPVEPERLLHVVTQVLRERLSHERARA